ncbi:MAG: AAA family ATPase [Pseudomonadota bacterium]
MSSSAALQPEAAPITACTICRDVQNFDLLIEDMEAELGESWGDLSFDDAVPFFSQPDAADLEFVALALDTEDEGELPLITEIISAAEEKGIKVILVAEDVSPVALHKLLRQGAGDFLPYPLPEGALHEALERMRQPKVPALAAPGPDSGTPGQGGSGSNRDGVILPVHGLAGGVGATTFAVNLAWELANPERSRKERDKPLPRVCLLDLDFQTGSTATYLDLPRRDMVYELLSDLGSVDTESFMQAMQVHEDRLHVLTAPSDMLPLDIVGPEEIEKLVGLARQNFDFVLVDMPSTLVAWSETVLHAAHIYFALMELDMRSAQNALRFLRLLKGEDLPVEKLRFGMNRAPKFTDLQGKGRVKRLAESLDIDIELQLPDGQKQVSQAGDHGLPIAINAAKNPLRKEIAKLAASLHALVATDAATG